MVSSPFRSSLSVAAVLAVAACADDAPDVAEVQMAEAAPRESLAVEGVLNTFIDDCLQIDQLGAGPGDANLMVGDDTDGSASRDYPTPCAGDWIDWVTLSSDIENHRILDADLPSGKDPTAFPGSNECVAPANVLSKMDLRYVAAANNDQYAYFGVLRAANNGDAGYYWLFTRKPPEMILGQAPCGPAEKRLVYDISGPSGDGAVGDVLIKGHFKPSSEPLLQVFQAQFDADDQGAVDAIRYNRTDGLWVEVPSAVAAVAVNTTKTDADGYGKVGVKSLSGAFLDTELFAEAAVHLDVFTGGELCGATFYGSVITRSSGSGGTQPDLKDLAGPALFNFGAAEAAAHIEPTCGLDVDLVLDSATGFNGQPIENPHCVWEFDDGTVYENDEEGESCDPTIAVTAGARVATLTVTDPVSGCGDTIVTDEINVAPPLQISAELTATCSASFDFDVDVAGGSGAGVAFSWSFEGGLATMEPSTAENGTVFVSTTGVPYTGYVTVTDNREDLECTAQAQDTATPYEALAVDLDKASDDETCPMTSDALQYDAVATGGDGAYTYDWNVDACDGFASCTIDPDDATFCHTQALYVTVGDASGLCDDATSETETYTKVTSVTGTDAP